MPSHSFEAIGTRWQVHTEAVLDVELLARIEARAEEFDACYSRFRADSMISRFATGPARYEFPADAEPLFAHYQALYEATNGSVTPLVGLALEHLGYDSAYSLVRRPGTLTVPLWEDVLTVDGVTVTSTDSVLLDLGAAGKGYLVDLLSSLLTDAGVVDHLIDASGDISHRGPTPVRIGLESPFDPTKAIGVANLSNNAICGSAGNRRKWGDGLHHIVDPTTGEPTNRVLATWAIAETAMVADGLATALFFTEPRRLFEYFEFDYVRILSNGAAEFSNNFDGELFT